MKKRQMGSNWSQEKLATTASLIEQQIKLINSIKKSKKSTEIVTKKEKLQEIQLTLSDDFGAEYRSICRYLHDSNLSLSSVDRKLITSKPFLKSIKL